MCVEKKCIRVTRPRAAVDAVAGVLEVSAGSSRLCCGVGVDVTLQGRLGKSQDLRRPWQDAKVRGRGGGEGGKAEGGRRHRCGLVVGSNGGENFAFVNRATVEIIQHQRGRARWSRGEWWPFSEVLPREHGPGGGLCLMPGEGTHGSLPYISPFSPMTVRSARVLGRHPSDGGKYTSDLSAKSLQLQPSTTNPEIHTSI